MMVSAEPFLLRFKEECLSLTRHVDRRFKYDDELDMLTTQENNVIIAAIELTEIGGLSTKKADIETAEDQKDFVKWR